ncbi:ATP-binding cassette domain-containing protein [Paracoccus sp. M683]|uniref:ABC transporter ATP-binding protein/permease n=1 Tax=Paracoccus sp. M683 TaxID=2594268 RepID=UPI00117FBD18|nr:ATP-binding cassette domain-containing protein [Paracoccus sp. M683]TRW98422.1 ATP-binding cassette domain-containing protein [Paracoccus sp. M683]
MKDSNAQATIYLAQLAGGETRRLRSASVLATLAEALWLVQAGLIAAALSALAGKDMAGARVALLVAAGGFLLVGLVRAGLNAMAARSLVAAGDRLTGDQRSGLLRQADRRGPMGGVAPSAAIAALATDKLALLLPYLRRWPVARMRVAVIPLLIVVAVLPLSWMGALILALTGPMIPVFMMLVGMAAGRASQDRMDEIADMNALLVERLTALTDIRLLAARRAMLAGFAASAERLRSRTMRVLALAFLSSTVLELFSSIGVALMAVFVGFSLLGALQFGSWGGGLGLGEGIFMLMLAPAFYQPMRDMAAAWHDRADALALARDLHAEMTRNAPAILGEGAAADAPAGFGDLRAEGLRIGDRILPPLHVRSGEAVVLTGKSGVGKTRLILILAGLADAAPGRVLIDGRLLDDGTADAWRALVALVPQRVHFTDDTLLGNLCGTAVPPDSDLQAALELAHAVDIVARLPQGLQTRLGEQGAGVSGGEARRLMIARAALRRPALLLADEPTADLDEETAGQVIDGLMRLHHAGATLILASHDPRLIAAMPREIRL